MHKITTPSEPFTSTNRTFSFSEHPQPQLHTHHHPQSQISNEQILAFADSVQRLSSIHNQCPKLSHFLIINSADASAVYQTLQTDNTLSVQLKERMSKYLKIVNSLDEQMAWQEHQSEQISLLNQAHIKQTWRRQINQHNNQSSTCNLQVPPSFRHDDDNQNSREDKKRIESTAQNNKRLSTSRYTTLVNQIQPLQNVSIEIKKYQPQKNIKNYNSNASQSRSTKSIINSQVSQSKCFNKIQLKSVKKVGQNLIKKGDKYQKQEKQEKQGKQVTKNVNKDQGIPGKQDKKYTISQRNKKSEKSLSYHVNNMKSNSRLRASRVQAQQDRKGTFQSSFSNDNKNRLSSKSNKKYQTLSPSRHQKCCSNPNESNTLASKLASSRLTNIQPLNRDHPPQSSRITGNNLVYETVQKSSQFLQMLRMMSQE